MDLRQSKEFSQYLKFSGWIVEKAGGSYVYLRKFSFFPPLIMKLQYPTPPIPFDQIEKLAKKYKPFQIQIQPLKLESGFKKYDYQLNKKSGHVTKTLQLDLTQSENKILSQIKKDARYGIKKAEKETIQIAEVRNLETFHQAWRKSVSWQRYVPSLKSLGFLKKAFGEKAIFLLAVSHKNVLGGTVVLTADGCAYYYYAFTSKKGRKKFAQYLLVWEAIKLAKKRKCSVFDFEGIYDKRFPIKSWQGFSHFKKSFGEKEIEYPEVFTRSRLRKSACSRKKTAR